MSMDIRLREVHGPTAAKQLQGILDDPISLHIWVCKSWR